MKKWLYILLVLFVASVASGNPFYFAKYGNDANDGLSWDTPKTNIQSFVQTSTVPNEIYVGAGEWVITNSHFLIPANQKIKGTNNTETIFKPASTNMRVIQVNYAGVVIDSISIMGASNLVANQDGGGIYCQADTIVTNCNIYSNHTSRNGGGVYGGTVKNSRIFDNTSGANGGGTAYSSVNNSDIFGNYTISSGGGGFNGNYDYCNVYSNISTNTTTAAYGGGLGFSVDGAVSNSTIFANYSKWYGGGIYRVSGIVTVDGAIVSNNVSGRYGGGIYGDNFIIINSVIKTNYTIGVYAGAGFYGDGLYISNTVISGNIGYNNGVGLYCGGSPQTIIIDCVISENFGIGGNIAGAGANLINATIIDSLIESNKLEVSSQFSQGAGLFLSGNSTVSNCIIRNNIITLSSGSATRGGAGIGGSVGSGYYLTNIVVNSSIYGNQYINGTGGGVAYVTLDRCLVYSNYATGVSYGGGGARYALVKNSVFAGNSASNLTEGISGAHGVFNCNFIGHTNLLLSPIHVLAAGMAANNIVWGNLSDTITGESGYQVSSNFFSDPMFLPDSYKLQPTSPCIDMGNDTYATNVDFYGRGRIYGSHVDIGASEWYPEDVPPTQSTGKKKALLSFWE